MEKLEKLVDAITNENPVEAEEIFKAEMGERIKTALAAKKIEFGKQLFAKTPDEQSQLDKLMDPEE